MQHPCLWGTTLDTPNDQNRSSQPITVTCAARSAPVERGFSTLPCSVVGCGAPVLPVLGLTLTGLGLTVATLESINRVSQAITLLVYLGVALGIIHLSRLVAADQGTGPAVKAG